MFAGYSSKYVNTSYQSTDTQLCNLKNFWHFIWNYLKFNPSFLFWVYFDLSPNPEILDALNCQTRNTTPSMQKSWVNPHSPLSRKLRNYISPSYFILTHQFYKGSSKKGLFPQVKCKLLILLSFIIKSKKEGRDTGLLLVNF